MVLTPPPLKDGPICFYYYSLFFTVARLVLRRPQVGAAGRQVEVAKYIV